MDPYEYLLSKFNIMLEFMPKFNTYSIYIKLKTGKKFVTTRIPTGWTPEKIFKLYKNIDSYSWFRQYDEEKDDFCQQLRQFPDDLESIEHVDLLLAVNGMNIGA